jgi:PRD1 phage membrane DNA delivery
MTDHLFSSIVTIATAIVGVAILAVLVSKNANTAGVIQAATSGFASDLSAAVAPVSGGLGSFAGGGVSPISIQ